MITKAEIRLIRSLDDKRARTDEGLFVAEGEKWIAELCASPLRVRRIYALPGHFADDPRTTVVSPAEMKRISCLKTPNNSLALVELPRRTFDPAALRGRLTLALDEVRNPGNLGTIIRLADWFGIERILCSAGSADCFNPKVVQASMGALLRVEVHYVDLPAVLAAARRDGVAVYGTFLEGDDLYRTGFAPEEGIIVLGNEGSGIRPETEAHVSHKLFIPPYPAGRAGSESLNVAMAAGIICAEFRRRAVR